MPSVMMSLLAQLEVAVQVQLEEVEGERMMPVEESLVVEVALPQAKPASKEEGKGERRSRWSRRSSMAGSGGVTILFSYKASLERPWWPIEAG